MIIDKITGVTVQYPFDPTATNEKCLIENELSEVTAISSIDSRIVIPEFGPFYARDLKLSYTPIGSNVSVPMVLNVDYSLGYMYKAATEATWLPVYGIIIIDNLKIAGIVNIEKRRIVGGTEAVDRDYVLQKVKESTRNPRVASWENINGKPTHFPPIDHEERLWAFEGLDKLIETLEKLGDQENVSNREVTEMISNFLSGLNIPTLKRRLQDLERHSWSDLLNRSRLNARHTQRQEVRIASVEERLLAQETLTEGQSLGLSYGPIPPIGGVYDYEQRPLLKEYRDGYLLETMEVKTIDYSPYNTLLKGLEDAEKSMFEKMFPVITGFKDGFKKLFPQRSHNSLVEVQLGNITESGLKDGQVNGFYLLVTSAEDTVSLDGKFDLLSEASGNKVYAWGKAGRFLISVPKGKAVWIAPRYKTIRAILNANTDQLEEAGGLALSKVELEKNRQEIKNTLNISFNVLQAVKYPEK